jgi:hypothetical protein
MATNEIVFMKLGDEGKSATQAPRKQFESYWSKKGFVEITAEEASELNKPAAEEDVQDELPPPDEVPTTGAPKTDESKKSASDPKSSGDAGANK